MNGDDSQRNEAGSSPWADDSAADVVEQGGARRFFPLNWSPSWRSPRGAAVLLAVGLVIGLAAGYAAGYRQAPRNASTPAPSSTPPPAAPAPAQTVIQGTAILPLEGTVTQATGTCAVQSGRELQLGVQVTNGSAEPVTLGQLHAVFPLGQHVVQRHCPGPRQVPRAASCGVHRRLQLGRGARRHQSGRLPRPGPGALHRLHRRLGRLPRIRKK